MAETSKLPKLKDNLEMVQRAVIRQLVLRVEELEKRLKALEALVGNYKTSI